MVGIWEGNSLFKVLLESRTILSNKLLGEAMREDDAKEQLLDHISLTRHLVALAKRASWKLLFGVVLSR